MALYTRSNLKSSLTGRIHNKNGLLNDINTTINDAVRDVFAAIDFRTSKRKASSASNLFNGQYEYACPTDLKGNKIIGFQPQNQDRSIFSSWRLTSEEEFDQRKSSGDNIISFSDRDFVRKVLVSTVVNEDSVVVDPLDSATSWSAFGDGTNLLTDSQQYIKGSGAIKFDLSAAGGTTAGITKTVSTYDLTDYKSNGSAFVWAWVTSATNLTNYKIRLGSDSSNYYEMTVTVTNDGSAFYTGWNLLRFDFSTKATTGTPDDDACDYVALYMTKTAGKISETDYRFDHIILQNGEYHNLIYYTSYPWQSSVGTYKRLSTDDTDYLNVSEDEYGIIVEKLVEYAGLEAREYDDVDRAVNNYKEKLKVYLKQYKSEALPSQETYYNI